MFVTGDMLFAHAVGDYVFQNHWMATQKTRRWLPALVHAITYTLAFVLVFGWSWALLPIAATHAVIDRYRLARLWCEWWGIGCPGAVWQWLGVRDLPPDPPPFISVWLLFIVDNLLHVAINAWALHVLGGLP